MVNRKNSLNTVTLLISLAFIFTGVVVYAQVDTSLTDNTSSEKTLDDSSEQLRTQTDELLKILQEGDTVRINEIKREMIENAIRVSEKNENEDGEKSDSDSEEAEDVQSETEEGSISDSDVDERTEEVEAAVAKKNERLLNRIEFTRGGDTEDSNGPLRDSDNDGISDYDEANIYDTDPLSSDSDGDGYIDGVEILAGFDPRDSSRESVIKYEDPRDYGVVNADLFSVSKIEVAEVDSEDETETGLQGKVSLEGRSLPGAFITIYIFSTPIVVTIKVDKEGSWKYTMDKELEDGEHEVYVAMTDSGGAVIAKSNPIPFVKEARAITVDEALLSLEVDSTQLSLFNTRSLYAALFLFVFIIGLFFIFVGGRLKSSRSLNGEQFDVDDQ